MQYTIRKLSEFPEAVSEIDLLSEESWPDFLLHGSVTGWRSLLHRFAEYQILFLDKANNLAAVGHTVPIYWNGSYQNLPKDISAVIQRAEQNLENDISSNTLTAMAAMVKPEHRRKGMSQKIIEAMIRLAADNGLDCLIAPLRPPLKSKYPLTPFDHYVEWKRDDGLPFDPWIRLHTNMGAKVLGPMEESLIVKGSISDWELWTGMKFPESGQYVVDSALQPVKIDVENNQGTYIEPNLWVCHNINKKS